MFVVGVFCPGDGAFGRLWISIGPITLGRASGWWGLLGTGVRGPFSHVLLLGAGFLSFLWQCFSMSCVGFFLWSF